MPFQENVTERLIEGLRAREALGFKRYGGPFQTFNGSNAIREALEEALDLVQYLFQAELEINKLRELAKNERLSRIYIAGPYSGDGSREDRERNTLKAIQVFHDLLDLGFKPFLPHLSHYADLVRTRDYNDWLRLDLEWIVVSDAILLLPGTSPGARVEVSVAEKLGIPVFRSKEELQKAAAEMK